MSEAEQPGSQPDTADQDDVKAKMKEALDRKHAREKAGQAHFDGPATPQHTHGKSGGQRQFRRKAGG